jgi:branched-chain amino acid aminotransferase
MDHTAFFGGEWMAFSQVRIDPLDRGLLTGDVVFDVARTFGGKTFRLREHVHRLYRSLKYVRIDPGLSAEEMEQLSEELVARNGHLVDELGDFTVWQFVTRGRGRSSSQASAATVCIFARPIAFSRFAALYDRGAHAMIVRTRSYSADVMDPKVKSFSRMNFNMAQLEAADVDPHAWPLLLDSDGNLTEGPGYNVFVVDEGVIRTPSDRNLLEGVSRATVFDLAGNLGVPVVEEDLQPYDLYTADEAFVAATSPCVLPVGRADHRPIGTGQPGSLTRRLLDAWSELVGIDIAKQAVERAAIQPGEG